MFEIYKILLDKHLEYPRWMDVANNPRDPIYQAIDIHKNLPLHMTSQVQPLLDVFHWNELEFHTIINESGNFFGDGWEIKNVIDYSDYETDIPTSLEYILTFSGEFPPGIYENLYSICYVDDLSGFFYVAGTSGIYSMDLTGSIYESYYYNSRPVETKLNILNGMATLDCSPIFGSFHLYNIYNLDAFDNAIEIDEDQYILSGNYIYIPNISGVYLAEYNCCLYQPPINLKTKKKPWCHYSDSGFLIFGNSYEYDGTHIHLEDCDIESSADRTFSITPFNCRPWKSLEICYEYIRQYHIFWDSSSQLTIYPVSGENFYPKPSAFSQTLESDINAYYYDGKLYGEYVPGSSAYYKFEISGDYSEELLDIYPVNAGILDIFYWTHAAICYPISGHSALEYSESGDINDYVMAGNHYVPSTIVDFYGDSEFREQIRSAPISRFSAKKFIYCKGMTKYFDKTFFLTDELVIYDDHGNRYYILTKTPEVYYIVDGTGNIYSRSYMHLEYNPEIKVVGLTSVGDYLVIGLYYKRFILIYYNPRTGKKIGYEFQFELKDPKDFTIGYDRLYILDDNKIHEIKLRHDYSIYVNNMTYLRENYDRIWKI